MFRFRSPLRPSRYPQLFAGILFVVYAATGLLKAEVAIEGPVGFVGDGYGRHEVEYLTKRVATEVAGLSFEDCGTELAAKDFANFRMVVIAGLGEQTYSEEDSQIVEDYIRKGGRLVLVQQTPKGFLATDGGGAENFNFLFGRSSFFRDGSDCTIYEPENPLLVGAFAEVAHPFWLNASVMLKGLDWENLIGNNDDVLVGRLRMGEGQVYYMGHEIFRLAKTAKEEGQEPALLGWIQIWKNILSEPEPKSK